jgi:hypothetical protein
MSIIIQDLQALGSPNARVRTLAAKRIAAAIGAGGGGGGGSAAWADITGQPSTFTPASHSHAIADVTGLQTALDSKASTSEIDGGTPTSTYAAVPAVDGGTP